MPFFQRTFGTVAAYRLGYNVQRPYPWRWTTPLVILGFMGATVFLALLNIPLSAYNVIQEVTYRPNDTVPQRLFSNLVPWQSQLDPAKHFAPQTLTVGNMIQPNGSMFQYTIHDAYADMNRSQAVTSFAYYNHPLSGNCDISSLLFSASNGTGLETVTAYIDCKIPTPVTLTWVETYDQIFESVGRAQLIRNNTHTDVRLEGIYELWTDFAMTWTAWMKQEQYSPGNNNESFTIKGPYVAGYPVNAARVLARPCCDCADVNGDNHLFTQGANGQLILENPLPRECGAKPASFIATESEIPGLGLPSAPNGTNFFPLDDTLGVNADNAPSFAPFDILLHNLFQAVYHSLRLDLGVVQANQIYTSEDMYVASISDVYVPGVFADDESGPDSSFANYTKGSFDNFSWDKSVDAIERMPTLPYTRTVLKLKDRDSAITSVFTSTFAMVSVLWTLFSLVAGALSRSGTRDEDESVAALLRRARHDSDLEAGGKGTTVETRMEYMALALEKLNRSGEDREKAIEERLFKRLNTSGSLNHVRSKGSLTSLDEYSLPEVHSEHKEGTQWLLAGSHRSSMH